MDSHLLFFQLPEASSTSKVSSTASGGSATGGNGGTALGGNADCSTGNSLIGLNTLNFNSCNGGSSQASGGSAITGNTAGALIPRGVVYGWFNKNRNPSPVSISPLSR